MVNSVKLAQNIWSKICKLESVSLMGVPALSGLVDQLLRKETSVTDPTFIATNAKKRILEHYEAYLGYLREVPESRRRQEQLTWWANGPYEAQPSRQVGK